MGQGRGWTAAKVRETNSLTAARNAYRMKTIDHMAFGGNVSTTINGGAPSELKGSVGGSTNTLPYASEGVKVSTVVFVSDE